MSVRGVLLDLEGVLYQGGEAVPGAPEAVHTLGARGLNLRFLTNTTTRPRRAIVERMQAMGFDAQPDQVFTPALAAGHLLAQAGVRRLHLATAPELGEDLAAFDLVDDRPDAVVMGDLHTDFTWERLDGLFRMVLNGARLVALHKNRYCRRGEDLALDLGPFVAALEYATGADALVVGKPSEPFFTSAVADMGLTSSNVLMVGDDIVSDIGGALAAGLQAVQVQTGKYRPADDDHPHIRPAGRVASIAALTDWLDQME